MSCWRIHELNSDGSIGRYVDGGSRSQGGTPEAALEAAASGDMATLYEADQLYLVSPHTVDDHSLQGAKVLRLVVPARPARIAEAVSL